MTTRLFGGGNSKNTPQYTGLQVQTSALNIPIPMGWGRNRITFNLQWWRDFVRHKHSQGKGGGGKGSSETYSVAVLLGLGWGQIASVPKVYTNQAKTTLSALGLTLFQGTSVQTPFSYITTKHPTEALSYPNIAYLATSSLDLGSSPSLPQIALEVIWNLSGTMPGTDDVNLGDVIPDFLTNSLYGMGLSSENIGDSIDFFKTYQQAEGLFVSPVLTSQEKATEILNRWALVSNSWIFWSGNEIKFVPLGDQEITANGVTYTPITAIRYNLGVDDFLDRDAPVKVSRMDPADAFNRTRVEIKDRALDYNSNPFEYKDQTLIDKYGIRDGKNVSSSDIVTAAVGLKVATLIGKRDAYLRNQYSWRTNHRFVRLEPGDLVTLTDPSAPIAIDMPPVRIKSIDCDEGGNLSFTAEDYPGIVSNFNVHDVESADPTLFDKLIDPGDVNPPCVFEPDSSLSAAPELWIAASGGENWGGCDVWISADDVTYTKIGTISYPAMQGVLTDTLASHADPDAVNTLSVDLSVSLSQLADVTHDDADAFRTLCLVAPGAAADGELLSYGDKSSTGTYTDDLTYLRRGLYGTSPASHSAGDQFTLLDTFGNSGSVLRYVLPIQYIGTLVYLKFLSFNIYGLAKQSLSDVSPYTYTTIGRGYGGGTLGVPTTPTGLAVSAGTDTNSASWNSNPSTDNVQSYKLYRAAGTGAAFGSASLIWQGLATSHADVNVTSGAGYTYFLSAMNAAGESGHTSGVNATSSTFTRPLRIASGTPGRKPNVGEVLFNAEMKTGDILPANLAGSLLGIDTNNGGVAPTADWTMVIKKNNTTLSTGTIAGAATTGSFSSMSQTSFTDGDFLSATCISPQDVTAKGVSIAIIGTRTQ